MRRPALRAAGQGFPPWTRGILQPLRVSDGTTKIPAMNRRRVGQDQPRRPFGRPQKPTWAYCLRLPLDVAEQVEVDAREAGYPTAVAFLRALATKRRPPYILKHRVYAELLRQLVRLGTNVNQLTRSVNAGKAPYIPLEMLQEVPLLLRRIYDFLLDPFEPSPLRKPPPPDE